MIRKLLYTSTFLACDESNNVHTLLMNRCEVLALFEKQARYCTKAMREPEMESEKEKEGERERD